MEGVNLDASHLSACEITSSGKNFFDDLCERISEDYNAIKDNNIEYLNKLDGSLRARTQNKCGQELLVDIYDHHFHIHQSDLGHYFRNLYYIVRYIKNCKIREAEKIEFIRILRSQLSNYELLLLGYNGLHEYGKEFYTYIEEYHLLKSLNNEMRLADTYTKRIIDIDILKIAYPHLQKHWK